MHRSKYHKTICPYCGVGCGVIVEKDRDRTLKIKGDPCHPANKGILCSKGMSLNYVSQDISDRILHPKMRWSKSHPMKKVSWDTALERAAAVFKSIIKKHGSDSVGFYMSGQCLTEEHYIVNKLTKGFIGTNNIDTNSRLCISSAIIAYKKTIGHYNVPISYEDIELSDTFLITGANPAWCHPVLFRRLEKHKEKNPNIKIIVIDPRKTSSCVVADLHLQIIPGTDVVLHNAIAKRLIDRNKIDSKFIKENTNDYEALKKAVSKTSIPEAAKICGITVGEIKLVAQYIGNAEGFMSMWSTGLNQSVIGVEKNLSLLNISLLTGHIGKPGSGPFSISGQANEMGGIEVGSMPNILAADKNLSGQKDREKVADFFGSDKISPKLGLTATEMFDALDKGKLKAIWIICTNPVVSLPDSNKIERALKKANFVIVQDISHKSETVEYADLILPAAAWSEKEGTMTNSERRVCYLPKIIEPPGEALPDAEIIWKFAQKMDFSGFNYKNTSEIYDEHCLLTKGTKIDVSGLSHERLIAEGPMQLPVIHKKHKGTKRLYTDHKFNTVNGKASFYIPTHSLNLTEKISSEFPLILNTGRIRDQWHTRTKTGKVQLLLSHIENPYIEMNGVDAFNRNLKDGDIVFIKNKKGEARVPVKISYEIRKGVVFMPIHFGKILNNAYGRANNLTKNLVDPVSKTPNFKYSAVEVIKYQKSKQKICVIGSGNVAYRFIKTYRENNEIDEIEMFSKKEIPFYDIELPEYDIIGLTKNKLQKLKKEALEKLKVKLRSNIHIASIDKSRKRIIDDKGSIYPYDLIIMATGSNAFIPKNVQLDLSGIFTIHNKSDVDDIKDYLIQTGLSKGDQHVVIVGGDLQGLELAATLNGQNVNVTIVQRASRLMERKLDIVASGILAQYLKERGIQIYFDNEVDTVFEGEESNSLSINLKTGKTISANAVVYAIKTTPNIELARVSKLTTQKGVLVNEYLQTSDQSIFAIGEIAQFNNNLFVTKYAIEQQADVAAKFILGDFNSRYKGSIYTNILKFEDLDLYSIGNIEFLENNNSYQEILLMDVSKRLYKRCIVKDDRLVGAIMMGSKGDFLEFKKLVEDLIENKTELSNKREELLRGLK